MAGAFACSKVFDAARACLLAASPDDKLALTREAALAWRRGALSCDSRMPAESLGPGQPRRPRLVAPRNLPRRGLGDSTGHAAFIHAVAHIERSAIDLAWDAVYRFRGLPHAYYDDWVRVAEEETRHFEMLRGYLHKFGHDYGDFEAHAGLWEMAQSTAYDVLARMAMVPRVLEARGLDVTPGMIARLRAVGDEAGAAILSTILSDEITHVAVGSRWFRHICEQRDLEPEGTFARLLREHLKGRVKCPLNREARLRAGFSEHELAGLEAGCREAGEPPSGLFRTGIGGHAPALGPAGHAHAQQAVFMSPLVKFDQARPIVYKIYRPVR
jgi:uncharacterized ferritin-like protein (DUF455 family)